MGLYKDKLEDMDISLDNIWFLGVGLVANTSNLNISKDIWKIILLLSYYKIWNIGGYLQSVSCLYIYWSPNERTLKKVVKKVIFSSWDKLPFSEKCQNPPNFEQVLLPNHWTYNGLWGILWKTITRSFIWYPRKWCMSNGLDVIKQETRTPSFMSDTSISSSLSLVCTVWNRKFVVHDHWKNEVVVQFIG